MRKIIEAVVNESSTSVKAFTIRAKNIAEYITFLDGEYLEKFNDTLEQYNSILSQIEKNLLLMGDGKDPKNLKM